MNGTARTTPIGRPDWRRHAVRHFRQPPVLRVLAVATSCAAMAMLTGQADEQTLDYSVGIVPIALPWLAAASSIAVAILSLSDRRASSAAGSLLLGALVVATAWSVVMLPFDALRIVRLVPLPLSAWGAGTRLLLLVGSACALDAALTVRQARQERCAECGRVVPGRLDRIPRWPVAIAVVSAMVYPVLRLCWALGSTVGTATGEPLELDIVLAWAPVAAGAGLVAFVLAVAGIIAGSWRLWSHRRDTCPACRVLMGRP
jgi:hypothetical protein